MSQIVTRFAPSPTGYLHIGGARTALFSWLLARSTGGTFLLRVEDTDRERSSKEATDAILDSMRWLGLECDGEPVFQSGNMARHNEVIDQLLADGKAYWCDCSKEQVDAMREKARAEGRKPKYDLTCREKNLGPGEGRVVRLKAPLDGATSFLDMVKGPVSWENAEMDDMILRRSDGTPTYNLAVVVDDHDMGVTHVLRGDDHVANTPRQILIYKALGWDVPKFGHVPLILGPDKKKLSKRHGALSAMEYEKMGYLPEAMVNYLARLGWSQGDEELFTPEELVKVFTTDGLSSSPAALDFKKLEWVNQHYIKECGLERLAGLVREFVRRDAGDEELEKLNEAVLMKCLPLLQPRAKTLVELAEQARVFLVDAAFMPYDENAVAKFLTEDKLQHLEQLTELLAETDFTEEALDALHRSFMEERGLKFKDIAQPIRVAITGTTKSPGLYETMLALGKDQTLARLRRTLEMCG